MEARKAQLYHAHHRKYISDMGFWKEQARGKTCLLELGCGTGRVMISLARAGHRVWGVDQDRDMLRVAREMIADQPLPVQERLALIQADMTRIGLAFRFEVVIVPCNTFSGFDQNGRLNIAGEVYRLLAPGGVFSFSVPNPHLIQEPGTELEEDNLEEIFFHPRSGNPVQVSSQVDPIKGGVIWRWHYDHLLPDGRVERSTLSTRHYYCSPDQYRDELERQGLVVTGCFGDFNYQDYSPDTPYLILTAQKSV